ncbi:hypothetical protein CSW58_01160 [Caulobacter sp. B11]|uniref:hypothetical protein n=1 Tax=Caulobacter sp. B11 TaxID=2048899 RepID=UPI000C12A3E0|nr:hypothetical protein [Caulobacter sp. B11]PHY14156.1 hypothetical protein CSW58_01160 [Caulobacter sp. B11]
MLAADAGAVDVVSMLQPFFGGCAGGASAAALPPAKPRASSPSTARAALEQAIEEAIAALDALDGDADLEDEPDLEDGHDREVVCEDEGSDLEWVW